MDFFSFTMKVPRGWRLANDDTLQKTPDATYRRRLHNKSNQLVYILTGLGAFYDSNDLEKCLFEQISQYNAKVFQPKKIGSGSSGLCIDSVGSIAGNMAGILVYSDNLDSLQNAELIAIIRTIKVKPRSFD